MSDKQGTGLAGGVGKAAGDGSELVPLYSSVEEVIAFTGIKPIDFDLEDDYGSDDIAVTADEKLANLVQGWLVSIKNFIDSDRNRDYGQEVIDGTREVIPPGIHNIALRAASNMASMALLRRETTVQRVDILQRLQGDEVFSAALLRDLRKFPAKPRFRMAVSKTTKPSYYDVLSQPYVGYDSGYE